MNTKSAPHLYQVIYNDLKQKIVSGQWVQGVKIPTEAELMDKYSVSRITAVRALQDLSKEGYIKRFPRKGSIVDFHTGSSSFSGPNQEPVKINAAKEKQHIAVISACTSINGLDLMEMVPETALKQNFITDLYISRNNIQQERNILQHILESDICGLICIPVESRDNINLYYQIMQNKIPIVFVDLSIPWIEVPHVTSDHYAAMYSITQHLIDCGHSNIAFCCNSLSISTENQRFRGYLKCLANNKLMPYNHNVFELFENTTDPNINTETDTSNHRIKNVLKKIRAEVEPPTAMACVTDSIAMIVQQKAQELNISIPDELSLTGFDNRPYSSYLSIPLSTVEQDKVKIGAAATDLLTRQINGETVPSQVLINTKLIIRDSVRDAKLK